MEISDETLRPSFIIPVPAWRLSAGSNLRCFHAVASRRLVVMPYSRLFSRHLERVACCAILHPTHRALSTSPLLQAFTAAAAGVAIYDMSRTFCRQTASVLANVLCSTAHTRPALQHLLPLNTTNPERAGFSCSPCKARRTLCHTHNSCHDLHTQVDRANSPPAWAHPPGDTYFPVCCMSWSLGLSPSCPSGLIW